MANPSDGAKCVNVTTFLLACICLYFEFGLLLAEFISTVKLYNTVGSLSCAEETLQGMRRMDAMGKNLLGENAIGTISLYLVIVIILSLLSIAYFVATFVRFSWRNGFRPIAFAGWWESCSDPFEKAEAAGEKEQGNAGPMNTWFGDGPGGPITGPLVYGVVGLVIGLLGYFASVREGGRAS